MKSIYKARHFDALAARLGALRPDSPSQWGRMTPHGAVCHLTDAFVLVLGERVREGGGGDVPSMGFLRRVISRVYAITLPLPWPKGVTTSPAADQEKDGTPPGDFSEDVAMLLRAMERFRDRNGRDMPPHVFFQHMSRGEWGRWGYRHMDHHLRQYGA